MKSLLMLPAGFAGVSGGCGPADRVEIGKRDVQIERDVLTALLEDDGERGQNRFRYVYPKCRQGVVTL